MKSATRQNPRTPPGVVGGQLIIEDPRKLCNAVTGRFLGQETVWTAIHDESPLLRGIRDDLCLDLAAEAPVLLKQNELDIVPFRCGPGDFVGCAKPGDAATNNDDAFHRSPI